MLKLILYCIVLIIFIGVSLFYAFPLAKVNGRSMLPTYKDGDVLLTTRLFNRNKLKIGQVYVYKRVNEDDGQEHLVVKRLTDVVSYPLLGLENQCYFEGDNPEESYDSRQYGFINAEQIVSRVIWQVRK